MHTILQVNISFGTAKEAEKIGKRLLKDRLIACMDIVFKTKSLYYWPPQKGKIKSAKGCYLYAYTLPKHMQHIEHVVEKIHPDKIPYITGLELQVNKDYYNWLVLEVKK